MRSLLLFLLVLAVFAATVFGAMQLLSSGDAPAAVPAQRLDANTRAVAPTPAPTPKPTIAPKPRRSAAERSGDRWVNQAESICGQFSDQVQTLMQNRTPRTSTIALFRKALRYERTAVARLQRLPRPKGRDGPLVDRLLATLDRHVSVFDAALDAMEARNRARIERFVAEVSTLALATKRAAADLGALTCSGAGPLGS